MYELSIERYNVLRTKYNVACSAVDEEFKQAALAELGLTDHPKADKLWVLAWEYGYSAGYQEIWCHAHEAMGLCHSRTPLKALRATIDHRPGRLILADEASSTM